MGSAYFCGRVVQVSERKLIFFFKFYLTVSIYHRYNERHDRHHHHHHVYFGSVILLPVSFVSVNFKFNFQRLMIIL
jgi:hypothetical protein